MSARKPDIQRIRVNRQGYDSSGAYRRRDGLQPIPIEVAKAAISVAVDVLGPVLLPQQLQRHALPLQLLVHLVPMGRAWPGVASNDGGVNKRRSNSASSIPSGTGQVTPTTPARRRYSATVDRLSPPTQQSAARSGLRLPSTRCPALVSHTTAGMPASHDPAIRPAATVRPAVVLIPVLFGPPQVAACPKEPESAIPLVECLAATSIAVMPQS